MKNPLVICTLAFAMVLPSFSFASGTPVNTIVEKLTSDGSKNSLAKVFFSDEEEGTLFIDFEAMGDRIISVNILSNNQLMLEDDVRDLPGNVIYEINLKVLREGTYTIELVTDQSIKIQKNIVID